MEETRGGVRWESGVLEHKRRNISETRKDRGKVTMEGLLHVQWNVEAGPSDPLQSINSRIYNYWSNQQNQHCQSTEGHGRQQKIFQVGKASPPPSTNSFYSYCYSTLDFYTTVVTFKITLCFNSRLSDVHKIACLDNEQHAHLFYLFHGGASAYSCTCLWWAPMLFDIKLVNHTMFCTSCNKEMLSNYCCTVCLKCDCGTGRVNEFSKQKHRTVESDI